MICLGGDKTLQEYARRPWGYCSGFLSYSPFYKIRCDSGEMTPSMYTPGQITAVGELLVGAFKHLATELKKLMDALLVSAPLLLAQHVLLHLPC